MAKAGMRRPDPEAPHGTESNHKLHIPKNDQKPVPEIQGKQNTGMKRQMIIGISYQGNTINEFKIEALDNICRVLLHRE